VIKLGRPEDGWTTQMAERELAVVLRDVDLGTWRPPRADPAPAEAVDPTFHEFASDWFAAKELEIEPNTANHYRNDLTNHLLPFFKGHHLSQITVAEVDRYRQSKVREAAEITAAAENGTPMTVTHVDRRGRIGVGTRGVVDRQVRLAGALAEDNLADRHPQVRRALRDGVHFSR